MKKVLFVIMVAMIMNLLLGSVVLADNSKANDGAQVFILQFPDVVSDEATARVMFADNWEAYDLSVMADCWLSMSPNAQKVAGQLASETQATWKSHPGATKYDVMLQLTYSLNKGEPMNDKAVVVSKDLLTKYQALNAEDQAYVLSSYVAAGVLVKGNA